MRERISIAMLLVTTISYGQLPMVVDNEVKSYQIDATTSKADLLETAQLWQTEYDTDVELDVYEIKNDKLAAIDLKISRKGEIIGRLDYANNFGIQKHIISWNDDLKTVEIKKGKLSENKTVTSSSKVKQDLTNNDDHALDTSLQQLSQINEVLKRSTVARERGQYLIFNGDSYTYYIKDNKTQVVDPSNQVMMQLDAALKQDDAIQHHGTVILNRKYYHFKCKNNILTITNSQGNRVNLYGIEIE